MKQRLTLVLTLVVCASAARAEHANITLRLVRLDPASGQSKDEATAVADQEPPLGGVIPRPLLTVKAHDPLVLQFIFVNTYPHGVTKDVTVRYFVARTDKVRQKALPDLKQGTVVEGEFYLHFKPKCRVGARVSFTAPEPGTYLLRVDSLNTSSDHEHFAAIDLQVE